MPNESRMRFPENFKEFVEEHKDSPRQPNIEVMADEGFLKELEDNIDEFVDEEDKSSDSNSLFF